MSTSQPESSNASEGADRSIMLGAKSALVIGMGGLGCPAALALARAGVGKLVIADDDPVDLSNLHRQILYADADVGEDKCVAAKRALESAGARNVEIVQSRFLPDNARLLVEGVDVVVEGVDNFATKFLAADACLLQGKPLVHGAAVRFDATIWSIGPDGRPCYRCLFEDLPGDEAQPNCAEAGVMGPVVGFAGALMADLALDVLLGTPRFGRIFTYDGWRDRLREVAVSSRRGCELCDIPRKILEIEESRYTGARCA